ncbi:hypothetical protein NE686_03840 [Tissierella carlieri]|uniref:Uncharacterized protein n=1 Tax=Tissierella carlieri TaxID=689904 RepID=A0ABT1S857_9FIRM|nr:hypothetical protein [Tissierella carlieri]MCQ4922202.1 hypothetical protein [Tissierella carlieri]
MNKSKVIEVLERVKFILNNYQNDLTYSSYNCEQELIDELDCYIEQIKDDDFSRTDDILLLFAPTGNLQEISMDSGWGREYIKFADIIDINLKYKKRP